MVKYNYNEFIGKRFGKITITDVYDKNFDNKTIKTAKCICDCGNTIEKRFYDVKDGKITSCQRCNSIEMMGKKYGQLTVIDTFYDNHELWCKVKCTCGNVLNMRANNLRRNHAKSCKKCDSKLLIGKTYGKLKVLSTYYDRDNNNKIKLWCVCRCTCGNIVRIRARGLKNNAVTSCGKCDERLLIGKAFGELKVINTFYKMNSNNKRELWCHCNCSCGNTIDVRSHSIKRKELPQISCGCLKISRGQKIIEDWLNSHRISFTKEETFNCAKGLKTDKCNYLRYDIYIQSHNLIIEFDGIQHFYPIEIWGGQQALLKTQQHDLIKNNWAKENGINLIRFNFKQTKIEIENTLNSLLL